MNEIFDEMQKIYQIDLPLNHGEEFDLEIINKDTFSMKIRLNDGAIFAIRIPRSLRLYHIGDKFKVQYLEYESNNKQYAKMKILQMIRE